MKQKLSSWWEEEANQSYIAKRALISPKRAIEFAPFTQFTVCYCGADFTVPNAEQHKTGITYLIKGEKEPPDAQEDSPWTERAQEMANLVGGVMRQDEPEIIPVLYVSMAFNEPTQPLSYSSDQVPLSEDANRTVRVVCGQFENVAHNVPAPRDVTVLDVVLEQGGNFTWQLPAKQRAWIYVVSGKVQIGSKETLANCTPDTLVWATGKQVYVSARCAGGRFFVVTLPQTQKLPKQQEYVQEVLPDLDRAKTNQ